MSAMPILNPNLTPLETKQKSGSNRAETGQKSGSKHVLDNLVVKCFDSLRVRKVPTIPSQWIGSIIGPVHDNGLGDKDSPMNSPDHVAYLFCSCNLGKIARFKECGIRVTDWKYLENWV